MNNGAKPSHLQTGEEDPVRGHLAHMDSNVRLAIHRLRAALAEFQQATGRGAMLALVPLAHDEFPYLVVSGERRASRVSEIEAALAEARERRRQSAEESRHARRQPPAAG